MTNAMPLMKIGRCGAHMGEFQNGKWYGSGKKTLSDHPQYIGDRSEGKYYDEISM